MKSELDEMVRGGIIERSSSEWAFPDEEDADFGGGGWSLNLARLGK